MWERVLQADSQRVGWPLVVTWVVPWVDWVSLSAVSGQRSDVRVKVSCQWLVVSGQLSGCCER